jgi:hypothetical protein
MELEPPHYCFEPLRRFPSEIAVVWWEVREIGGLELGRAAWLKIYGDPLVLKAASRAAGFPIWRAITDIPRKMTTARLMEQPSHSDWPCKQRGL